MKIFHRAMALCLCILSTFTCTVSADECLTWYIIKKGNETPGFPNPAVVDKLNGYYIDTNAAQNNEKILYLTFDAGYENGNVSKILDILKENNIPGAFFILSNIIIKNPEVINRMFNEGHLVCNHTKNHKNMSSLTNEEMAANLGALENLCLEKTGKKMEKLFRFPEGKYDERTLKCASELGYKTFFWSLTYADWDNGKQPNKAASIKKMLENTHDGAVILLHPTADINVAILPELISAWKEMGYSFGSLNDLIIRNQ